jgi:hypothetical protein
LEHGYYPYYKEGLKLYWSRIQNVVNVILENDLPAIETVEYSSILKLKKLLMILSAIVPYTPNINKLSGDIETGRVNTLTYLDYLERAKLIQSFSLSSKNMGYLTKPDKIYLDNTNLLYALCSSAPNIGNIRETFFANQLAVKHTLNTSKQGDFLVDNQWTFEVGGPKKTFDQIKDLKDSFVVADEIETEFGNKIPLWLFGFTY